MKPLNIYATVLPLALATLSTTAQATDLVYGSYLSPEHGNNKYGVVRFIEEAERASEG
jgi:TRAP-type transport system periplasmic protein